MECPSEGVQPMAAELWGKAFVSVIEAGGAWAAREVLCVWWGGADSRRSAGLRALAPFQHPTYRECGRPERIPRHRLTVLLLPVELCEMSEGIRPMLEPTSTSGSAALGFTALLQPGLPPLNGENGDYFFPFRKMASY